jgi:hypothetical protein
MASMVVWTLDMADVFVVVLGDGRPGAPTMES